jgi:signal transduction histidine kinase
LAVLFVICSFLPWLQEQGTRLGDQPARPLDALGLVTIGLECLPLALRRRWPALSLVLVGTGFAIDQLRGYHTVAGTALPVALLSAGLHLSRHRRLALVLMTAAYVPLAIALNRSGGEGVGFVTFYLLLCVAWGAGAWLRQNRAAEAERRRLTAEATRTAERTRIARELHDVVTHHVTAMVVQAEAARYLTAAPEKLDATLSAVTDTGRRAMSDLRHLLDLLNPDHAGSATVGDLASLIEQTRRAGQPVEFTEEGSAGTAGSAEATAYRVVREALTNALKYDHGGRTVVLVRHGAREVTVEVSTDGSGSGAASPGGSGRGLDGLRERVGVLGGEFSAGPRPGGGFLVRAGIPAAGTA